MTFSLVYLRFEQQGFKSLRNRSISTCLNSGREPLPLESEAVPTMKRHTANVPGLPPNNTKLQQRDHTVVSRHSSLAKEGTTFLQQKPCSWPQAEKKRTSFKTATFTLRDWHSMSNGLRLKNTKFAPRFLPPSRNQRRGQWYCKKRPCCSYHKQNNQNNHGRKWKCTLDFKLNQKSFTQSCNEQLLHVTASYKSFQQH